MKHKDEQQHKYIAQPSHHHQNIIIWTNIHRTAYINPRIYHTISRSFSESYPMAPLIKRSIDISAHTHTTHTHRHIDTMRRTLSLINSSIHSGPKRRGIRDEQCKYCDSQPFMYVLVYVHVAEHWFMHFHHAQHMCSMFDVRLCVYVWQPDCIAWWHLPNAKTRTMNAESSTKTYIHARTFDRTYSTQPPSKPITRAIAKKKAYRKTTTIKLKKCCVFVCCCCCHESVRSVSWNSTIHYSFVWMPSHIDDDIHI